MSFQLYQNDNTSIIALEVYIVLSNCAANYISSHLDHWRDNIFILNYTELYSEMHYPAFYQIGINKACSNLQNFT